LNVNKRPFYFQEVRGNHDTTRFEDAYEAAADGNVGLHKKIEEAQEKAA